MLAEFGVELIGASVEAIHTAEDRSRVQGRDDRDRPLRAAVGSRLHGGGGAAGRRARSASRSSAGRASSWAAAAPASPTTSDELRAVADARPRGQPGRRDPARAVGASAGRSTSSRSCATTRTTWSSSARSRTSTRWACTPATRSPSRPRQTLTDVEYQRMRDAAFACIRRIGVETGGSNVQFGARTPPTARWSSSR